MPAIKCMLPLVIKERKGKLQRISAEISIHVALCRPKHDYLKKVVSVRL